MTCPACNSMWIRGRDAWEQVPNASAWNRYFVCGDCGRVFVCHITEIGRGVNDIEATQALHNRANGPPHK